MVLDEIGYRSCTRQSADLLYNIISRRHENRSLVLTTNLPFSEWTQVIPNAGSLGRLKLVA